MAKRKLIRDSEPHSRIIINNSILDFAHFLQFLIRHIMKMS
jgi:hypothetical protein